MQMRIRKRADWPRLSTQCDAAHTPQWTFPKRENNRLHTSSLINALRKVASNFDICCWRSTMRAKYIYYICYPFSLRLITFLPPASRQRLCAALTAQLRAQSSRTVVSRSQVNSAKKSKNGMRYLVIFINTADLLLTALEYQDHQKSLFLYFFIKRNTGNVIFTAKSSQRV